MGKKLSERVSRTTTLVIILCILLALLASITALVSVLEDRECRITNYSTTKSTDFYQMSLSRLAYNYKDGDKTVKLGDIVKLSDGAFFEIQHAYDGLRKELSPHCDEFDVSEGQTYFIDIVVVSEGGARRQNYEITIKRKDTIVENDNDEIVPQLSNI